MQLVGAVDHVAFCAQSGGQLGQAVAVGAGRAADDDDHVHLWAHYFDGILAVLGGVADVLHLRLAQLGEAGFDGFGDFCCIVHAQGGLRHQGEFFCL